VCRQQSIGAYAPEVGAFGDSFVRPLQSIPISLHTLEMQMLHQHRTRNLLLGSALSIMTLALLARVFLGFYTIQPIGALPEGRTLVVWRQAGEPFFNSPDATCLARTGSVSLLCRAIAVGDAPVDRILLRLPYLEWAYEASTGGARFDR
jgi:hypothetical protein